MSSLLRNVQISDCPVGWTFLPVRLFRFAIVGQECPTYLFVEQTKAHRETNVRSNSFNSGFSDIKLVANN